MPPTGGHHPVELYTWLKDRYEVCQNLYQGPKSSIWLVEDKPQKRMAMVKILTAEESRRSQEISIARLLQQQQQKSDHPGKDHVVSIFDTFTVVGPSGTHDCIVTEVLGISLRDNAPDMHKEEVKKKVVPQVALGVAYLHKCGIVHGNLNRGNVLFHSRALQEVRKYDTSSLTAIAESCLGHVHVKITDFGEASLYQSNPKVDKPFETTASILYRTPEVVLQDAKAPTYSMDIWALGVLIFTVLNEGLYPFPNDEQDNTDKQIVSMVKLLGRLPPAWWNKWKARPTYFFETGTYRDGQVMTPMHHFERMSKWKCYKPEEVKVFAELFKKMFAYVPERRISAEQVVQGLPDGWKVLRRRPRNDAQKRKGNYGSVNGRNDAGARAGGPRLA